MKILLSVLVLLGAFVSSTFSQSTYSSRYLTQDPQHDSEDRSYHPSSRRYQQQRSYESSPYNDVSSSDPKHYQSLDDARYQNYESESYPRRSHQYNIAPQRAQYQQKEDPSYHRSQEVAYHQAPQNHQELPPEQEDGYKESSEYEEPEEKEDSKYAVEEPKYTRPAVRHGRHPPTPLGTDPKLPLYFTMYEKRTIQDPTNKYGKGPWRYLTYGHGITYGSKEPGKVFEKGYGYIRALGRDHCKLPEHLCPPTDDNKPFDYEGRKEPYFGYRPH